MIKTIVKKSILLIFIFSGILRVDAQNSAKETVLNPDSLRTQFLIKASDVLQEKQHNRVLAIELASEKGWVVREVTPEGQVISLEGIDSNGMPIYFATDFNVHAAATTGADKLWPGGSSGLNLSGGSPFMADKLGIWDGGNVRGTHQEFGGRIIANNLDASISNHATHVAATMMGTGVNPYAKGMAFQAPNIHTWAFSNHLNEMAEAAPDLLVSNHSYGRVAGWRFNGDRAGTATDPNWEWLGDINVSETEDYKFGYYDEAAAIWDMIAYHSPYYLIVKSSGNNRGSSGPGVGQRYMRLNTSGSWESVVRGSGMSNNDAYNTIPTYGNAKNILSIGAVNAIPSGYKKPSDVVMSSFSSWGPTDDGRLKPDVVGNGVSLYSASSSGNSNYTTMSGTSMSAPNVSGSIFLLQEHFHLLFDEFMLSSTLRGLVCHTADDAGRPGPDYVYGWGLVNVDRAAQVISNRGQYSFIDELVLESGGVYTQTFTASGKEPLVITIAWTDPEAEPISVDVDVLNNRTPRLVNDLDLRVYYREDVYKPWVLNVENPSTLATTGDNVLDNIEQVVISNPVPGREYSIAVTHKGEDLTNDLQVFSLIATGVGGSPLQESRAESSEGGRIERVVFATIDNETEDGLYPYRDFTHITTSLKAGASYAFNVYVGGDDENISRAVRIYADWNSNAVFEEEELLATSHVITGAGSFSGEFSVPGNVTPGSLGTLRIVLQDTDNPEVIAPTGLYDKGETQDYLLVFERSQFDVGPVAFILPAPLTCVTDNLLVEVRLENHGSSRVEAFPVQLKVYKEGDLIESITEIYAARIEGRSAGFMRFMNTFKILPETEYRLEVTTMLEDDQNNKNDTHAMVFHTQAASEIGEATAVVCGGEDFARLTAEDIDGVAYWYKDEAATHLIGAGSDLETEELILQDKVYMGVNRMKANIGPESKDAFPWISGTYARATAQPLLTTHVPLTIQSARMYVGYEGSVILAAVNVSTGEVVSIVTLQLPATRTTPSIDNGAPDDPHDVGIVVPLGLNIPEPGDYRIQITYGANTTLYRSTGHGADPYPYQIPGIMEITGTTANPGSTNYYYWLYDMEVSAYGCGSEIVEIPLQQVESPTVLLEEWSYLEDGRLVLDARNEGAAYRWNTGARTQTIMPLYPGNYWVNVTNEYGCLTQASINVTEVSVEETANMEVKVFPNPTTGVLHLEAPGPFSVRVFTLDGREIHSSGMKEFSYTLDLSGWGKGVFFFHVNTTEAQAPAVYRVIVQ